MINGLMTAELANTSCTKNSEYEHRYESWHVIALNQLKCHQLGPMNVEMISCSEISALVILRNS